MSEWPEIPEAQMLSTDAGNVPASEGWFVMNVADAKAEFEAGVQYQARFESRDCRFQNYGINVQWLYPGHGNCKYHREDVQESILILSGEATLIVEDRECPLKQWDFVHLPSGTAHVLVGAGDEPCAVLFVGGRKEDDRIHYPVSDIAGKYGASVAASTDDPSVAYADEPDPGVMRMPWPTA